MKPENNLDGSNLFQEIGELALTPVDSACNIIADAFNGQLPTNKDVTTVIGGIAALFLLAKIF